MELLFLVLILRILSGVEAGKRDLYVLAFWRTAGYPGETVRLAINMALDDINARTDILPEYNLHAVWEDTECNPGLAVNRMYKQLYQPPTKIMILGAMCSTVTEAIASTSQHWDLITISYLSASPALSDPARFPLFFRLSAPLLKTNNARIALMKYFNWGSAATIDQPFDLFSKTTEQFARMLRENNMRLITAEIFMDDVEQQLINIKRHDARIIFLSTYEPAFPAAFCNIYKHGLYGPRYVWIVNGFNTERWWLQSLHKHDCTVEEMMKAVEGIFSTALHYGDYRSGRGIAGYTSDEWMKLYLSQWDTLPERGLEFPPIIYDTAWTAALALNKTALVLKEQGLNNSLEDYEYGDKNITRIIFESIAGLEFTGVKGPISFDEQGDGDTSTIIRRVQHGEWEVVGFYNYVDRKLDWDENHTVVWKYGRPPRDATHRINEWIYVDSTTYYVIVAITSVCIVMTIGFGTFNFIHRQKRFIKMSSPKMNNVILSGCVTVYITVFLQEMSMDEVLVYCKIRTYGLMIGFSMAFGALFAKTWRVYAIFMNRTRKVAISDWQLFLVVGAIAGIDLLMLLVREVSDPLFVESRAIGSVEMENGDVLITKLVWVCTSSYDTYFQGVTYAIKGLLLIFGAFLAWQTRTVEIPALNDSQYIGICIYNVAVLSLLGVVLLFALQDQILLSYIISCCIIIFATTATQMMIFIPKISKFQNGTVDAEDSTPNTAFGKKVEKTTNNSIVPITMKYDLKKKTNLLKEAEKKIADLTIEVSQLRARLAGSDLIELERLPCAHE